MAVEIPETQLIKIRKNLKIVGETIDETIVDMNKNVEVKEDKREKIWKENIIDKGKTRLTGDEKKRFLEISKIFVREWVDQVRKFKEEQEKQKGLRGLLNKAKKKITAPFRFISDFFKKKKEKIEPPQKKKMSWLTKLLLVIGGLGAVWIFFKAMLSKLPGGILDKLKGLGNRILELAGGILEKCWEGIKQGLIAIWEWIKSVLPIDKIGEAISNSWNTLTGWFNKLWDGIKNTWKKVTDYITALPGRIWDWICEAAMSIFSPIINAITSTWDWLCDTVVKVWNWIKDQINKFWEGLKSTWQSICDFFSGIWDWVTDTFSFEKIWGAIKDFFTSYIQGLKEDIALLLEGKIFEFIQKKFAFITDMFDKAIGAIKRVLPGWLGGNKTEQEQKEQVKTKVQSSVEKIIEKQDDIVLKDNILETIKSICDRINIFFSGNKNGFIDLSKRLIDECTSGFKSLHDQLKNIKLENIYQVDQDIEYNDSYDQADRSVKTINNDSRKTYNNDYSITYNNVDIPALKNAMSTLQKQSEAEIKLLESQNDYLAKMISNIDGLGNKLTWLDPSKFKQQQNNMIIPIIGANSGPNVKVYDSSHLKQAQLAYARALNI